MAREIATSKYHPRIALVLPTSLCAGQVSLMIAEHLNRLPQRDFDHAVALPHTEGCGNSGGESERLFMRTMAGYLAHTFVGKALLLEHGCEKTHNDAFRNVLRELQLPESRFGFCSIQLDGGIERVTAKSIAWFQRGNGNAKPPPVFAVALHAADFPENLASAFGMVRSALRSVGSTIVLSDRFAATWRESEFCTLSYGEQFRAPGEYVMECPTDDDLEIVTGFAATGVHMIVLYEPRAPVSANPLVPTVQLGAGRDQFDLAVTESESASELAERMLRLILEVRCGRRTPVATASGNVGFQITRGYEGISL